MNKEELIGKVDELYDTWRETRSVDDWIKWFKAKEELDNARDFET